MRMGSLVFMATTLMNHLLQDTSWLLNFRGVHLQPLATAPSTPQVMIGGAIVYAWFVLLLPLLAFFLDQ